MSKERKLSGIILELATRLLREPEGEPEDATAAVALLLATAAWNLSEGDTRIADGHRRILRQIEAEGGDPCAGLVGTDTDRLIADLVEYKRRTYPDDRRVIEAAGLTDEGNVRVEWQYPDERVAMPSPAPLPHSPPLAAPAAGAIAKRVVSGIRKRRKRHGVDLAELVAGRSMPEDLRPPLAGSRDRSDLHSAHDPYMFAQNLVSFIFEHISTLDEMAPFARIYEQAEDEYMPSGPPMSPLTASYFTCWAFFDACCDDGVETIGATILHAGAAFGMDPDLSRVIGLMQASRMGVFVHEGASRNLVSLRELVTGATCRAFVPAGYRGRAGELWYARVLPPSGPGISEHLVFTTPYVLLQPARPDWEAYFRRTLPDAPPADRLAAHESHMKFGPTRRYWNEFVLETYVNHQTEAIYLAGLPDSPESRPNSRVNRWSDEE